MRTMTMKSFTPSTFNKAPITAASFTFQKSKVHTPTPSFTMLSSPIMKMKAATTSPFSTQAANFATFGKPQMVNTLPKHLQALSKISFVQKRNFFGGGNPMASLMSAFGGQQKQNAGPNIGMKDNDGNDGNC
eukprot:UN01974